MQKGSIVIIGELIGFVTGDDKIYCSDNVTRQVNLKDATEVINPNALALLFFDKIMKGVIKHE